MPSMKSRINLTVSSKMEETLQCIAKRDETTVASAALQLIEQALEFNEDRVLAHIAEERDTGDIQWVSHEDAWK